MRQSSLKAQFAVFVLFVTGISGTITAFAPLSKSIAGSLQPRVSLITNQCTEDNDVFAEKEVVVSTVDEIPRGGANINKLPPKLPSISTYRRFALPCLGLVSYNRTR